MLTLSVIILSYNRREALAHSLDQITKQPWSTSSQIIVVDNASTDGSAAMVRERFPHLQLIDLDRNTILEGFNIGARAAKNDLLLILDDDSWPNPGAVEGAIAHFEREPNLGGLMLHRRHPKTLRYEWPFSQPSITTPLHAWPDMGCGNMIRREVWERVGGYETRYTLYRNDTDLALKILNAGYDCLFDPTLLVWHDSIIAAQKSNKWLNLSTRNWMWMAKRHARGTLKLKGMLLGWLHAHRLAGLRPSGHLATLRGMLTGLFQPAPSLSPNTDNPTKTSAPNNTHYQHLLDLKIKFRESTSTPS